jgi:hypothetical protein
MNRILKIIKKKQEAEEVTPQNESQITEADAIFSIFTDMFGGSFLAAAAEAGQEYIKEAVNHEIKIKAVESNIKEKTWIKSNNGVSDLIKRRKTPSYAQIGVFNMIKYNKK